MELIAAVSGPSTKSHYSPGTTSNLMVKKRKLYLYKMNNLFKKNNNKNNNKKNNDETREDIEEIDLNVAKPGEALDSVPPSATSVTCGRECLKYRQAGLDCLRDCCNNGFSSATANSSLGGGKKKKVHCFHCGADETRQRSKGGEYDAVGAVCSHSKEKLIRRENEESPAFRTRSTTTNTIQRTSPAISSILYYFPQSPLGSLPSTLSASPAPAPAPTAFRCDGMLRQELVSYPNHNSCVEKVSWSPFLNQLPGSSRVSANAQGASIRSYISEKKDNVLKTFQLWIILIHTQLVVCIFNKFRKKRQPPPPPPQHKQQEEQKGQQLLQQPPPLLQRLKKTPFQLANRRQQQQQPNQQKLHHHEQLNHFYYLNMPNLTFFYMIVITLSFLLLLLPSTHALTSMQAPPPQMPTTTTATETSTSTSTSTSSTSTSTSSQVRLSRTETVCKSLDIRNTPSEFRQLENCTVIEGFLLITLVNTHTLSEFTETFPLLTEVTEFIIVYQVHNLRSLSQIFPNLSVIRGRNLFEGYALIVYSNLHLEDLGLSKLTTISRGGVRIEKNLSLCFVETIDWSQIVTNTTDIVIENNRDTIECPQCPGDQRNTGSDSSSGSDLVCKEHHGRRNCWNSRSCQKICPERCRNNCLDENTCCNESCLGGCSPDNLNECISCRNFSIYNNTCTDKCPDNYYSYLNRRCLTAESCTRIGTKYENNKQEVLVPYDGRCSTRCPEGYSKVNLTCQKCGDKCLKKCVGGQIDSVARAKEYHGCTHIINEGLTIIIKRGGRHLMEDLEYGLSSIEVISTYLKVQGTYGMFSLEFFKNLKLIKGEKLIENKYAFYVLENTDLETIWARNHTVRIEEGTVYFHFNPKLCLSEIEALLPMMKNQTKFDKNEVSEDSNGSRGSCNTTFLNVTVTTINSQIAIIEIANPMKFEDERTFIGYQYLYIEDKYKNATKHGYRPCDDGWTVSEPTKEIRHFLLNLKPFTQYAYYVKTMTISTERRNAQSPIQHFKTKSDQPRYVEKLYAYANSSSEIVMTWLPPTLANGNLTKYKVRAVLDLRNQKLESRNYCKDPIKETGKVDNTVIPKTITERPRLSEDCKCQKKESVYDEENADANIHASIELENALQNFVYVKKTNRSSSSKKMANADLPNTDLDMSRVRRSVEGDGFESFLLRHIRDAPDDIVELNDVSEPNEVVEPNDNDIQLPVNETRLDPFGQYYEVVVSSVNASTTEFVFTKLKHFSVYMLGVEACREPEIEETAKECSEEVKTFVRTHMLDDVDKAENLHAFLEPTNTSRSNIRLHWDPPTQPNGAVVSYTILYELQTQDAVEEKKCITEVDYRNMTNGYVLTGLPTGNYSIRVRTNSLAGEGKYSNTVYIYIPPTTPSPALIAIICVALIILLLLIASVVYFLFRKRILAPPSDLKIFPSVNPYYISLQYIPDDWEVPRERIIQLSPLGQGSFGMVYEGILKGYDNSNEDTPCAIKTVNENATDRERMNFLNEASVMKQFDTYHVVRLLGVCSRGQPALVIMELMKNGDLKSYLRAHRPDEREGLGLPILDGLPSQPPPLSRIYQMAIEIADGMAYLAAKKFVHRDLAARNCMVAADLTVKIGDFGMTRDIYETDYYRKGTKGLLPVRWMPPESLRDGVYSTASDVFSYGVVLWEMATLASQPYQGLSNDQVLRYVIDGGVMERPENCSDKLYSLMQKCWHHRPSARPTFMEIIRFLVDKADPHFRDVSFYHSEEGQQVLAKEIAENEQRSGDVFDDNDNDMEDVTTPLRMDEYAGYKLNLDNNSSIENNGNSPVIVGDDHPHSPYSLGSAIIVSSTPDGQSKNSFNLSQTLHNNQMLSSAPSTSTGVMRGVHVQHPHTHPHQRHLYQPFHERFHQHSQHRANDIDAYVQPDFDDGHDFYTKESGKSVETDERGYEIYDPSPNYCEHVPDDVGDVGDVGDDEDNLEGGQDRSSGGQSLLPRQKGFKRLPTILPLSSSVPDEVIGVPAVSSLHPSTASAASSNTSSKTATVGKYPTLRAVADTVQNMGTSLMPSRLRMINRRIFNHKRSGSNSSYKSTRSNPNTSSNSNTNLERSGRGKSMSGQNLGTIESGGSGSASSYTVTPRFFTPAPLSEKDKAADSATATPAEKTKEKLASGGFALNSSSKYQILDNSLNTTGASADPSISPNAKRPVQTGETPNYEQMQQSKETPNTGGISNYVVMNEPKQNATNVSLANVEEEEHSYKLMGPVPPAATSSAILQDHSAPGHGANDRFNNLSPSSSPSSCERDCDCEPDAKLAEHIKLERLPASNEPAANRVASARNRGSTDTDVSTNSTAVPTTTTTNTTAQVKPSTTYTIKEKWFNQQQPPPPPPNGFVGRDT